MEAFRSRAIHLNPAQTLQVSSWLDKTYTDFVKPKITSNRHQKYHRLLLQVQNLKLGEQTFNGWVICVAMLNTDDSFGETRLLMAETNEEGQVVSVREEALLTFDKLSIR
ncbi:hypothetical protein [Burkholderia phage FLC9]|nr:hypothetical protein [Burkholderia phage FLC9]